MPRARFVREEAAYRRESLIDATARTLAERGVGGTSVREICRRAGVSPGLLTHYFDGIDELIAATYRDVGRRVLAAVAQAVASAGDEPREQLEAYVTASFRPPVLDPGLLATWLGFWGMVKTEPAIAAIHREHYGDFRQGIEILLRRCWGAAIEDDELRLAAVAMTALVDGLWLELCLDLESFTPVEAEQMALAWLASLHDRYATTTPAQ